MDRRRRGMAPLLLAVALLALLAPMVAATRPAEAAAPAGFTFRATTIGPALRTRMATSWRRGCPVPLPQLRYVQVAYWGFDGRRHVGELVVRDRVVADVRAVFASMYRLRFPIRSLRLVDDFGGSDEASMAAGNSSAFNCRQVAGSTAWSEHAYGTAIDLNPIENPYVRGSVVQPPGAVVAWTSAPGTIKAGDAVVRAFASLGWSWGGRWRSPDLQHFSSTGR